MIMTVRVETAKGLYAERTIECYNMQKGLSQVITILEGIPDEINGMSYFDWTKTIVTFEDRPWNKK